MTSLSSYTRTLTRALRSRDVPGETIGEIVAQVESHLAETGEDPVAAFGTPRAYAARFAISRGPARRWRAYLANWILATVFGCVLIIGVMAQLRSETLAGGIAPLVSILVGAAGLVACAVTLVLIGIERVRAPRATQ